MLEGGQLPLGHRDRLVGLAQQSAVTPELEMGVELCRSGRLQLNDAAEFGRQPLHLGPCRFQLLGQAGSLGFEGRDHVGVSGGVERLEQRTLTLAEHPGQATGPLHHALGASQGGGQIRFPLGGHLVGGPLAVCIELA